MFELDNVKNEAILRDFVIFQSWQHQKRSNSARLPLYFNLTTSKTKQFCETPSFFEVDNIKNERILRDFLQKWKVECRADGLVPMRFAIYLSKLLRLPRKKMHLCRSSSNVPRLPSFLEMLQNLTFCSLLTWSTIPCACHAKRHLFGRGASMWRFSHFDFEMCFAPKRRALFRHRNFQKWREREVFLAVSLADVLRTTTACTFSTCQLPKNGPRPWVFNTFDFEMCFAPQRRTLFQHLHLQKWSERFVFLAFSLAMCFVPERRALFRHLNFQKWSGPGVLCTFWFWKCASRHNGVQFFISHLASWLRTRRFSEPTFRPSGATNHWKNTVFRDIPTFSRTCIFFLLTLSRLWSSLFCSSLLYSSAPPLLFICPCCRKFDF